MIIDRLEPLRIVGQTRHPSRQNIPRPILRRDQTLTHGFGHVILHVLAGHLVGAEHRKHGLGREQRRKTVKHIVVQRRAETRGHLGVNLDPAIVEQHGEFLCAQIEQRGRIARDAVGRHVVGIPASFQPQPDPTFAQT